jgi:hypothetical protein
LEVIVYTPFSRKGTIRQQDIQACNITRSVIARSLEFEARRTTVLVNALICKIQTNQMSPNSIEALWNVILNDSTLRELRRRTDANVDGYCRFNGWVEGVRRNLASDEKRRLEDEIGFRVYTYRFGHCRRAARLHLIPA